MRLRLALIALLASALACHLPGGASPTSGNPADVLQTQVAATLTAVASSSGATSTLAPTSAPAVLPHPLYFLANRTGSDQVWRGGIDGATLMQITDEAEPITDFDVSPADGSVAYVTGNQLILADANGGSPRVLLTGPPLPATPDESYWTQKISNPVWSPDGTRLAYAFNGLGLITPSTGQIAPLLANIIPPPDDPVRIEIYRPRLWSPDGSKILLEVGYYEGGGLKIIPASGGAPLDTTIPDGMVCCHPSWSSDGAAIFLASDSVGMISSGLWRVDASSGVGVTLSQGGVFDTGPFSFVGWPKQTPDGRLRYFFGQSASFPDSGTWPLSLYESAADGVTGRAQLRTDSYFIGEALWAPDANLVVISDITDTRNSGTYPWVGPLRLLKLDNSPAIALADAGRNLRWGR